MARDNRHTPSLEAARERAHAAQAERDERLVGALPVVEPSGAARSKLFAELSTSERFTLFASDVARVFELSVEDARAALRQIHDAAWLPGRAPGISVISTPALAARDVVIARLESGVRIPRHGHSHREVTLVLDGLLREDDSTIYRAGDVLDAAVGLEHEVEVSGDHPCLAVFHPARV